jgi:predicted nucleic acid-binding protein
VNHALHYCLDTDMCIYLLNGHPRVKTRVAEVGVTALAVAIPTVGELYFGAYNSGRKDLLLELPEIDCHERKAVLNNLTIRQNLR